MIRQIRTSFVISVFVILLASCSSSTKKPVLAFGTTLPTDFETNLFTYGNVKAIKSKFYELEDKFGELKASDEYTATIENFNEDGIFTKFVYYDEDGDIDERYETTIEKNSITVENTTNKYRKGSKRILSLNDEGQIIKETYDFGEADEIRTYSYGNGNLKSVKVVRGSYKSSYSYSDDGMIIDRKTIYEDGEEASIKYIIEKDNKGNIISLSEESKYPERVEYSEFDNKGNWTKATIFDEDDAYELIVREIEYY